MANQRKLRRLVDAYAFPGFRPQEKVRGVFGDPKARLVTLIRRSKKHSAESAARRIAAGTTVRAAGCGTCPAATAGFTWMWKCGVFTAVSAKP